MIHTSRLLHGQNLETVNLGGVMLSQTMISSRRWLSFHNWLHSGMKYATSGVQPQLEYCSPFRWLSTNRQPASPRQNIPQMRRLGRHFVPAIDSPHLSICIKLSVSSMWTMNSYSK